MENKLYSKEQVIDFIEEGRVMFLAGSPNALAGLPKGKWIAGSAVYFLDKVGRVDEQSIFVNDFTDIAKNVKIEKLDSKTIEDIGKNGFEQGFTLVSIPVQTEVLDRFAKESMMFEGIYDNPVVGFVAGIKLGDFENTKACVATGIDGKISLLDAAVMYVELKDGLYAHSEIFNFDEVDPSSPKIVFPETSFTQSRCLIDGKDGNIADLLLSIEQEERRKLVLDMNGAVINRETANIDPQTKQVTFFAPIMEGDTYRFGRKQENYLEGYNRVVSERKNVAFTLSCIVYYNQGGFEGQPVNANGIFTFGEIAYQLLNKTVVTLEIGQL